MGHRGAARRDLVVLTPFQAVRYGLRLRRGLDLITVSLLLIPVTPGVLMLTAAMGGGDDRLIRLGLLVLLEHGLWLGGLRVATEFAVTQPAIRGVARRARWAAAVDAVAAMCFVLSLGLAARYESVSCCVTLYTCLATALFARAVALWAGAGAVAGLLRALRFPRFAWGLRGLAALACLVTAVAALGLGLILYAEMHRMTVERGAFLREAGYLLLLMALPLLWCVALASGGVCMLATRRLNDRFGRVGASLRRAALCG